jgi:hypothetical protein
MCDCNCVTNIVDVAFLGVGENRLVIGLYPGCDECEQSVHVTLRMMSQENFNEWVDQDGIIDLAQELTEDGDELSFAALDWAEIGRVVQKDYTALEEYNCFADFWSDHQDRVKEAAWNSVRAWQKKQNK